MITFVLAYRESIVYEPCWVGFHDIVAIPFCVGIGLEQRLKPLPVMQNLTVPSVGGFAVTVNV